MSQDVVRRTERWFVRQGVPHLIEEYGFAGHVLPRMLPFLAAVLLASVGWFAPLPVAEGLTQAAVIAGVSWLVALAALLALIVLLRRYLPRLKTRGATVILIAYAAAPVLVPLALVAAFGRVRAARILGQPDGSTWTIIGEVGAAMAIAFATIFAIAWLVTTYGLVPLAGRAVGHAIGDMRGSFRLQGLALPTLLFVTLFLFFTSELWQLMNHLAWWRLLLVLATFAAVTVLATASRLRREIDRVEQDLNEVRLTAACAGTPLADHVPPTVRTPRPLNRRQISNILLVLATRQLIQAAVVGLGLFTFFVVLGLIILDETTASQLVAGTPERSAWVPGMPVALFRSATMLAGFGSMYFAITAMTDEAYRRDFFEPVIEDVERTLAVRAVYLTVREQASD